MGPIPLFQNKISIETILKFTVKIFIELRVTKRRDRIRLKEKFWKLLQERSEEKWFNLL